MKKSFSFLLTIVISVFSFLSTGYSEVIVFSDVSENDYYYEAVKYGQTLDFFDGYSDGSFRPDNKITRAEFLKMVMKAGGISNNNEKNCFKDVSDQWFASYICSAKKDGIVKGYSDGTFKPEKNISFVEASKIITEALDLIIVDGSVILPENYTFQDSWFEKYVTVMTTESTEKGPKNPGAINGGFYEKTDDPMSHYPSVVIAVEDINEHMKKVKEAGGRVLGEPINIPKVGMYVSFIDTEGNRVSMLQPSV